MGGPGSLFKILLILAPLRTILRSDFRVFWSSDREKYRSVPENFLCFRHISVSGKCDIGAVLVLLRQAKRR